MLKIGHRGAPFQAFENTITSFRRAIELGADGIELDVRVCKTGELVVFHDIGMERHTTAKAYVRDLTLSEIKAISLPGNERISTLSEVFQAMGKDIYYFIELKAQEALLSTIKLMEEYIRQGWKKLVLISYFEEARHHSQLITIAATFAKLEVNDIERAKAASAVMIIVDYDSITQAQIYEIHKQGMKIIACTINEPTDIVRIKSMGVDGIMSDYPDRLSN